MLDKTEEIFRTNGITLDYSDDSSNICVKIVGKRSGFTIYSHEEAKEGWQPETMIKNIISEFSVRDIADHIATSEVLLRFDYPFDDLDPISPYDIVLDTIDADQELHNVLSELREHEQRIRYTKKIFHL